MSRASEAGDGDGVVGGGGFATDGLARSGLARLAAFPLALWLIAFLFFGGNLGWWSDDLAMAMRDPATGAIDWSRTPWDDYPYFWRPIQLVVCYYGITLSFRHDWIAHAVTAGLHAWAAWSLFRLARTAGIRRESSAVGSLTFMLWPLTYEVALWPAAASTAIGGALAAILARHALEISRRERIGWTSYARLFVLAFLIPCANEQPACVVAAMPLLILAARRGETAGDPTHPAANALSWRVRLTRAVTLTTACGVALLVYLGLMFGTAPKSGSRSSVGSLIGFGDIGDRVAYAVAAMKSVVESRIPDVVIGGFRTGWDSMNSPLGVAALTLTGAAAAFWTRAWIAGRARASVSSASADARAEDDAGAAAFGSRAWVLAFAVAWFAAAWVPIMLLKGQIAEVRLLYPMWFAIALGAAVVLDPALAWVGARRGAWATGVRAAAAAGTCVGLVALAVCLVGTQAAIRAQTHADARQAGDLKGALSSVPEKTVFALLRSEFQPARTGREFFDGVFFAAWWAPWSASAPFMHEFGSSIVGATYSNPWKSLPLVDIDGSGFTYLDWLHPGIATLTPRGSRVSWDQTVPYVIDEAGRATAVHTVYVERADGRDLTIHPTLMHGRAGLRATIALEGSPERATEVEGWIGPDGVTKPTFDAVKMWGVTRAATLLRPAGTDAARGGMSTLLPAETRATNVVLRATFNPLELREAAMLERIDLRWTLRTPSDGRAVSEGVVPLSPSVVRHDRRWVPVVIPVAASSELLLEIRVGGSAETPSVWVTRGWRYAE